MYEELRQIATDQPTHDHEFSAITGVSGEWFGEKLVLYYVFECDHCDLIRRLIQS